MRDSKTRCELGGSAVKAQGGSAAGFASYLDLKPVDALADAGAEGLGSRFLGGKARGEAFRRPSLAQAVGLFRGGEDAVQEALSEALEGLLDSGNLDQIDASADNHPAYEAKSFGWAIRR